MHNDFTTEPDNTDKGMIFEKAVSESLWNNFILHNYNPWDDKSRYPCGDAEDHYIIEHQLSVECKNHALKTVENYSPKWVQEQIISRGSVDVLVITYEPKSEIIKNLFLNGIQHIVTVGFQVTPDNYDEAVDILTEKFHLLFNKLKKQKTDAPDTKIITNHTFPIDSDVGVCNSCFIVSYFISYLLVNCVFDSVVNVFYMIIDDKPKINDPPDNKNNKIIDDCVSETNNNSNNIIQSKTNSNNKFYLTLNPNKITSKIKNRLDKTNHRLISCLNEICNKLNPNRLFYEKRCLSHFVSFG